MARSTPLVLKAGARERALRQGTIKRIHVRGEAVKKCKQGNPQPCLTIQTSKGPFHCSEIAILGPSQIIERFNHPIKSGAGLWIETRAEIEVIR